MTTISSGEISERDFIAEYFIVRVYRLPPPGGPLDAIAGLVEDKNGTRRSFHTADEIGRIVQESVSMWWAADDD